MAISLDEAYSCLEEFENGNTSMPDNTITMFDAYLEAPTNFLNTPDIEADNLEYTSFIDSGMIEYTGHEIERINALDQSLLDSTKYEIDWGVQCEQTLYSEFLNELESIRGQSFPPNLEVIGDRPETPFGSPFTPNTYGDLGSPYKH